MPRRLSTRYGIAASRIPDPSMKYIGKLLPVFSLAEIRIRMEGTSSKKIELFFWRAKRLARNDLETRRQSPISMHTLQIFNIPTSHGCTMRRSLMSDYEVQFRKL